MHCGSVFFKMTNDSYFLAFASIVNNVKNYRMFLKAKIPLGLIVPFRSCYVNVITVSIT